MKSDCTTHHIFTSFRHSVGNVQKFTAGGKRSYDFPVVEKKITRSEDGSLGVKLRTLKKKHHAQVSYLLPCLSNLGYNFDAGYFRMNQVSDQANHFHIHDFSMNNSDSPT